MFFVISGFVICMSGWGRPLQSFFASRASRLLPAYWAAVLLVTAVFALPVVAYRAVSPSDALVNLTMLQSRWASTGCSGVLDAVGGDPLLRPVRAVRGAAGATRRRVIMFCAGWTLAAAIARGREQPLLDIVLMPEYAPFFIGGIGLYLVHRDRRDVHGVGHRGGQLADRPALRGRPLWHAPDPDVFSHRTSFGHHRRRRLRLRGGRRDRAGLAGPGELALADGGGRADVPLLPGARAPGLGGRSAPCTAVWGCPPAVTFALTIGAMLVLAWLLNRYVEKRLTPAAADGAGEDPLTLFTGRSTGRRFGPGVSEQGIVSWPTHRQTAQAPR